MIELNFGKEWSSNCETWIRDVTTKEPHTLEEWEEWGTETYGKNRFQITLGKYTTVFEVRDYVILNYSWDDMIYELFDIYQLRDTWGQVEIFLKMHGKTEEETQKYLWSLIENRMKK